MIYDFWHFKTCCPGGLSCSIFKQGGCGFAVCLKKWLENIVINS